MSHQYIYVYNISPGKSGNLCGQYADPGQSRAVVMSIERLQQAAYAAGYAMAPDDDAMDDQPIRQKSTGTALALATSETHVAVSAAPDAVAAGATWLKSLLPAGIGGRATA